MIHSPCGVFAAFAASMFWSSRMAFAECTSTAYIWWLTATSMWVCASMKPGTTVRPPASNRRASAAFAFTSVDVPTCAIRPERTSTASAFGCDGSTVTTLAFTIARSPRPPAIAARGVGGWPCRHGGKAPIRPARLRASRRTSRSLVGPRCLQASLMGCRMRGSDGQAVHRTALAEPSGRSRRKFTKRTPKNR